MSESMHEDLSTLPEFLLRNAAETGNDVALLTDTERLTYAELTAQAQELAAGLMAVGVAPSDRVAIWLPNGANWLVAHWAAAMAGAILVPINTRNRPTEVRYILEQSGAAVLFLRDYFLQTDYLAGASELLAQPLPELRAVIVRQTAPGEMPAWAVTWEEAVRRGAAVPRERVLERARGVRADDVHVLMYTSGSTGLPKGAMLTHEGLIYSAGHHADSWELHPGDAILVPNPMSHIMGLVFGVLMPVVTRVAPVTMEVFAPELAVELIQHYRIVLMTGAPSHYQMLADHPRLDAYDVSSLRVGMAGGAASTPETVRRVMQRLGLTALVNGLGMSEAGSVAHTVPTDPPEVHATAVGHAMPWLETRIVDPLTGRDQEAGQVGELWIRGPGVMKGYFRNPEATAQALTADGWLRTGDLIVEGADGNLRFAGRLKDMFTVGGFNVYPAEVERMLAQHPAVAECQVFGVPDARLGEVPFAYVRFRDGASATEVELRAFCVERVANYKVPRYFQPVTSFPMLSSGKRDRRRLVDDARAYAEARVGAQVAREQRDQGTS